jgi:putative nucleotidyltransferase with HDIG domain
MRKVYPFQIGVAGRIVVRAMMQENHREKSLYAYRLALTALGIGIISLAGARLVPQPFDARWLALAGFAAVGSWLASSRIPGDKNAVTVSDTLIFLTMLLCGADAATVVAATSALADSARYVKRWLTITTNLAVICCSFFISASLVQVCFGDLRLLAHRRETFFVYALSLAVFAGAQALVNLGLVLIGMALKTGNRIRRMWRENYSWVLVTYFSGVIAAAVVNALIHYYGFGAVLFVIPVLLANYLAYRPYVKNIESARRHIEEMHALHLRTLEAFATAVDAKDQITHEHAQRVQIYAEGLAHIFGLSADEVEALRAGALLHDIGKLAVPDYILNKPGKLTPAEFERMKIHTTVGAEIINTISFPYPVAPIVRHHHERWDGYGYPDRLRGEQIPLTARILALVDCYDSITDDRPYSQRLTREAAIAYLREHRGTQFDPQMVDLFLAHLEEFDREVAAIIPGSSYDLQAGRGPCAQAAATTSGPDPAASKPLETYFERISTATREFNTLYQMAHSVGGSLELDTTLGIITEHLRSLVFFDTCAIYLTLPEGGAAKARYVDGPGARALAHRRVAFGEGLTGWVLAHQEHFYNTDKHKHYNNNNT